MKKILLLALLSFLSAFSFAQNKEKTIKHDIKNQTVIDIDPEEYARLKDSRNLIAHYEYNIKGTGKTQPSIVNKTSAALSPCDPVPYTGPNETFGGTLDDDTAPVTFPFDFCFYGTNYTSCNLSINGNIQFSTNSSAFTSTGFPSNAVNMLAPFWTDVYLTAGGSLKVDIYPTRVVFSWDNLGYYSNNNDLTNSFQCVITNGLDPILPPGKNVGFYYRNMEWTTGDVTGANGFPTPGTSSPAMVGANAGDGINYYVVGRFGMPGNSFDGAIGNDDGVSWLNGKRFFFNFCPPTGANLNPNSLLINDCDTFKVCGNDSLIILNIFDSGEISTQTVNVTASAPSLGGAFSYSTTVNGNNTSINMFVDGNLAPAGFHVVTMTATDNGTPPKSSVQTFSVFVDHATVNNLTGDIILTPTIGICPGGVATASLAVTGGSVNSILWGNGISTPTTSFTMPANLDSLVYVTIKSGQCKKTVIDYIHVNPVPVASITGNTALCTGTGSTTVLTASNTLNFAAQSPYTYSWSGSSAPSPTNQQTTTATGGSYSVTITNKYNCKSTANITVNLQVSPVFTVVPTSTTACGSATVPYSITFGAGVPAACGLATTGCATSNTKTVGTGFLMNSSTSYPAPYANNWDSQHFQMLFTASELIAAGITPGKISSLAFNAANTNTVTNAFKDFTIKLKCTSATNATSWDMSGLSQVYSSSSYIVAAGWNTHVFNTAYEWNGTSNLLVDVCYNDNGLTFTRNVSSPYTVTTFTSVIYGADDGINTCGLTSGFGTDGTSKNRPNVRFGNCSSVANPNDFTYAWSPSTGLSNAAVFNPTATVNSSIIYTVVLTPTAAPTCTSSGTSTITITGGTTPTINPINTFCTNAPDFTLTASPTGGTWSLTASTTTAGVFTPSLATPGTNTVTYTFGPPGCAMTTTATLSVEEYIPATLTGSIATQCNNSPALDLNTTASPSNTTGVWSGPGVTGTTFDPVAAGTGTIILTYSTNSSPTASLCPNSQTISVEITPVIQPTITSEPARCSNAPDFSLTANPTGGTWTSTAATSSLGVFSPSLATIGNNIITYSYGGASCALTTTSSISIEQFVPATLTNSIVPQCASNPAFDLNTTTSPVFTTGTWSGAGVTGTTFDPSTAGAGTITLTYNTASAPTTSLCPDTRTINVIVDAVIQPSITAEATRCSNAPNFTLIANPTGGTWTASAATSTTGVFSPSLATVGNNMVTYSYTNGVCTRTVSDIVTIEQFVTAVLTNTIANQCESNPAFDLNTTTTPSITTGVWSGAGVTGTMFDPSTSGTGTITLTYSTTSAPTASLCPDTRTINVIVDAVIQPSITPVGPFCSSTSNFPLTPTPIGGVWNLTASTTTAGVFSPSLAVAGNNTVTYSYTNGTCTRTVSSIITIEQFVSAALTNSIAPQCASNPTFNLNTTTAPAVTTGTWSGSGVTGTSFNPATAGTGTITLTYSTTSVPTALCTDSRTINVIVNAVVQPSINPENPRCSNAANFMLTPSPSGGLWTATVATSTTGVFSPSLATIGNNTVTYTYVNGACTRTVSAVVAIQKFESAAISGSITQQCIYNPSISLLSLTTVTTGVWSGSGVTGSVFTPSAVGTAGAYTLTYTTNSGGLCEDAKTTTVTVNRTPTPNIIITDPDGCAYPFTTDFRETFETNGTASWDFGNGSTLTGPLSVQNTYNNAGTFSISVTFTDNVTGCVGTSSITPTVTVYPVPEADFEAPVTISIIDAQVKYTNLTPNPNNDITFLWNIADLQISTETDANYLFVTSGIYTTTLVATNSYGCQDTMIRAITITPDVVLYVPNAFTPGDDGLNDKFQIFLPPTGVDYSTFNLVIYDRWGGLVYKATDVNEFWNGARNNSGEILPLGIYVWKITFKDEQKKHYEKVGHVTLLQK